MIGIKGGTQTWSSSPQHTDFKPDGAQNLSAADRSKALGGEDSIGDVLNKVAEPGYVDTSKKMRTVGNNQLGKDAFMSLLLTQMKNQDPTNPLKSHEMAAQLAQFTTLEKMNNINEGIEGLRKDQQPSHNFEALSFIGKTIDTDNSKLSHLEKDAHHDIRFTLPGDAQKLSMQVKDAEGKPIRTIELKNLKSGANELAWNGLTDDGVPAPVGDYTVAFDALGSNGHHVSVETKTQGVITGVNFTPRGPQLMVGKHVVNMADVKSIRDSNVEPPQLPPPPQPSPSAPVSSSPKKVEVKTESKSNGAKHAKMTKGDLNDAAMAQGLINELNKAGAKAGMGS